MSDEQPATVRIDVQDPLPEQDWGWRRVFTYTLTLICCGFLLYCIHGLAAAPSIRELYSLAWWLTALIALLATYYLLAPSAEQIVKMIQASRNFRHITPNLPMRGIVSSDSPDTVSYTQRPPNPSPEPPQGNLEGDGGDFAPRGRP